MNVVTDQLSATAGQWQEERDGTVDSAPPNAIFLIPASPRAEAKFTTAIAVKMRNNGGGGSRAIIRNTEKASAELSQADAQAQLDSFLAKYDPEVEAYTRRALAKMRKLVPGAIEMVYDNYNWLVIGFGPSQRPSEAILSLVLPPGHVTLCFLQGASLPDPAKRLRGSGNVVRNIRLYNAGEPDAKLLDDPAVLALINVALNRAKVPMPARARRKLIIRSISARQKPRRIVPGKK